MFKDVKLLAESKISFSSFFNSDLVLLVWLEDLRLLIEESVFSSCLSRSEVGKRGGGKAC